MTPHPKTVEEYIGCLLSMAKATLYDHPTYDEAIDQEALDVALEKVHMIMAKAENKNAARRKGASMHISEI